MRILGIGNLNRMGEIYCQIFRDLGHEADLLIWNPGCKPTTKIKPIKVYGIKGIRELNLFRKMLELRKRYDFFVCHYAFQSAIFANWISMKYVCHARGHDITHNTQNWLYGRFVNPAFKNAESIWCSTPVLVKYAKKYNRNVCWIPNIIKTDIYKTMKVKKDKSKITIFMPARHVWEKKGNDIAVRLLKKILKRKQAELHFIEWGRDVNRTKGLIRKLEIEKTVIWHAHTLDERKIAKMYNSVDVVWDSFRFSSDRLNLIALEAMSCNANLLILQLPGRLYPDTPPLVQARNFDDFIDKTINFESSNNKQRKWIIKYNSYGAVKKQISEYLNKIIKNM